jgi:hypothetical protein
MANGWTDERRASQAAQIARWSPWLKSTGPRSAKGKKRSSRNSLKHGAYSAEIRRMVAFLDRWS